jgi:hypothetical protein
MTRTGQAVGLAALLVGAAGARAEEARLGIELGADVLQGQTDTGGALALGLRWMPLHGLAANLDLGYGILEAAPGVDDRWWAIPGVAWVAPIGALTLDLGGGFGVGTVSGYDSWNAYVARPFDPVWHTTAPAASLHVQVDMPLGRRVGVFARTEIAALLPDVEGTVWGGLWLGVRVGVL